MRTLLLLGALEAQFALAQKFENREQVDQELHRISLRRSAVHAQLKEHAEAVVDRGLAFLRAMSLDLAAAAVPLPRRAEIALKVGEVAEAQDAYRKGDNATALDKIYGVASWAILELTTRSAGVGAAHSIGKAGAEAGLKLKAWRHELTKGEHLKQELNQLNAREDELYDLAWTLPYATPQAKKKMRKGGAKRNDKVVDKTPFVVPPPPPFSLADLDMAVDDLCYMESGDRCFDGRPDALHSFLKRHPEQTANRSAITGTPDEVATGDLPRCEQMVRDQEKIFTEKDDQTQKSIADYEAQIKTFADSPDVVRALKQGIADEKASNAWFRQFFSDWLAENLENAGCSYLIAKARALGTSRVR